MRPARPGLLPLIAIAASAAAIAAGAQATHLTDGLEHDTLSARFSVRDAPRYDDVAVVGIDGPTFSELGVQWPFRRSLHGHMIERLHAAGAREIVYDVQFTEPTTPREDGALYRSIARSGGAVLVTGESDGHGHSNVLGGDDNLRAAHARAAAGDLENDRSGAITRFPRSVGGIASAPVVAAERTTGRAPTRFERGGAWIDYRGGPGAVPTVSFASVLRGRFSPGAFRGKIVVVGATTPTLQDVHPTPTGGSELMSGPEVQANAIATALRGNPLRSAPPALGWVLVALMALVAPLLRVVLRIAVSTAVTIAVGLLYVLAVQLAFDSGTVLIAVGPLLSLAIAAVGTIVVSHVAETLERRRVSRTNAILESKVRERTAELRDTQLELIRRLGAAVESRDKETGDHISRMSLHCQRLAIAIGMDPREADLLKHASALHDIGKLGIPDRILQKPGRLDADEWKVMKTHTTLGAQLLAGSRAPMIRMAETIALTHHERWDGSGYPNGTAGEDIPLIGRIASICDVFDALISSRPYKDAWDAEDALAEIASQRGRQFDPDLVDPFLALARESTAAGAPSAAGEPGAPGEPAAAGEPGSAGEFPAELLLGPARREP